MKKALFVFAAAAAILAGCQIEENFAPKNQGKVFYGEIENDATRTQLTADGNVYHVTWNANDRVSINEVIYTAAEGGAAYTYFVKDTTIEDPAGPYKAYFPISIAPSGENPGLLPGGQTYMEGTTSCIPMMATSESVNLTFKNLCAMLKLNITTTEAGAEVKKIEVKADQPMAGAYTVADDAAVVAEGTGVTLYCAKPVAIGATAVPFFISVPANTYTGMTVKVTLANGKSQTVKMKAGSQAVIERSKIYEAEFPFNNFADAPAVTGKAVLLPGPDFNAAIKALSSGGLTEDEDLSITRIIFDVLNPTTEGAVVSDASSEVPVYATFDKGSGFLTVSTAADKIYLGEDASYLFHRLTSIEAYENINVLNSENTTNMDYMFSQMTPLDTAYMSLKEIDLSWINTEKVTSMMSMFNSARCLESLDLSKFNTSNCENTRYMFGNCRHLKTLDLSNFDFSKDTSMAYMFYSGENLTSIKFPETMATGNVENFRNIFYNCATLTSLDVSKFDTSGANDMYGMFYYCGSLTSLDISSFDFSNDSTMTYFFAYDSNLVDLTLPKSIDCTNMQYINSSFRKMHIPSFDMDVFENTENILGIRYMFAYNPMLTKVTAKNFDFSSVESSSYMFYHVSEQSQTLDLSDFNVETLAPMGYMFYCFDGATLNLDNWDTSNCTSMNYMFYHCKYLGKMILGKDFFFSKNPTNFSGGTSDTVENATASVPGKLDIYCTPETANWIKGTLFRKVNNGGYTGVPYPITFFDLTSGSTISVDWPE